MKSIYIIKLIRYRNGHDVEEYLTSTYFNSEEEAKNFLEKKYGNWLDRDHLYIRQSGLWRYKLGTETGIGFRILEFKAA